jgi:hypothetical protein
LKTSNSSLPECSQHNEEALSAFALTKKKVTLLKEKKVILTLVVCCFVTSMQGNSNEKEQSF